MPDLLTTTETEKDPLPTLHETETGLVWICEETIPRIRRKKDSGDGSTWQKKNRMTEAKIWTVSTVSGQQKMKSMADMAGREMCLP